MNRKPIWRHEVTPRAQGWPQERLVEKMMTYTLEVNGRLFVIENVPARVNEETGEQFFSPQTVELPSGDYRGG